MPWIWSCSQYLYMHFMQCTYNMQDMEPAEKLISLQLPFQSLGPPGQNSKLLTCYSASCGQLDMLCIVGRWGLDEED